MGHSIPGSGPNREASIGIKVGTGWDLVDPLHRNFGYSEEFAECVLAGPNFGDVGSCRAATPFPSSTAISWSTAWAPRRSMIPDGQRITMESTLVARPRPKCSRGSLADSKL